MKTAALIATLGVILIGAAIAIVMAWRSAHVDIGLFGWIVIGIGAVLAIVLGGGLMALSFYSSRRGFDDRVDGRDGES
ncbi:MAG: hypothetical protein IV086_00030 [Hyphomonadaceae bacterium]|nr:MAG: hypothetical protein FD160_2128 [Caulobacteraceae bacterium]MBT9444064.1 hypothetical protein [Hyphomonadaceae bacterium]TPW03878.1 MAG: hypothetical protein FD124_2828 [Alphaproteobacteria bacterium]